MEWRLSDSESEIKTIIPQSFDTVVDRGILGILETIVVGTLASQECYLDNSKCFDHKFSKFNQDNQEWELIPAVSEDRLRVLQSFDNLD
ncbi:MAG: hypothetical protein MK033_05450 [Candidatus Caenarcaniphilales bacterium]|nr:hypothetical protein [Candidatus Caenarcaniphilales bacterium]